MNVSVTLAQEDGCDPLLTLLSSVHYFSNFTPPFIESLLHLNTIQIPTKILNVPCPIFHRTVDTDLTTTQSTLERPPSVSP